jgi:periplasmic divalent cation tolerance protein
LLCRKDGKEAMKKARGERVVLVTCGSMREARRIAREVVDRRLAACVNILRTPVESVYRWKGKVERAREYLLLIKTTRRRLSDLEKIIRRLHSYEVPELLALPVAEGSNRYLDWLDQSVRVALPARKSNGKSRRKKP